MAASPTRVAAAATDAVDEIPSRHEGLQATKEALYKDLHAHPALSHQERRTARRVAGELDKYGCTVQAGIGGTGVVGLLVKNALDLPKQTVSEDFGVIPASAGVPYTHRGIGRTDRRAYLAAEKAGRLQDLPSNHSPKVLPPLHPTLRTGTEAMIVAAMACLTPQ